MFKLLAFVFFSLFVFSCSDLDVKNIRCSEDVKCPSGYTCDDSRVCIIINSVCSNNNPCSDNKVCKNGTCVDTCDIDCHGHGECLVIEGVKQCQCTEPEIYTGVNCNECNIGYEKVDSENPNSDCTAKTACTNGEKKCSDDNNSVLTCENNLWLTKANDTCKIYTECGKANETLECIPSPCDSNNDHSRCYDNELAECIEGYWVLTNCNANSSGFTCSEKEDFAQCTAPIPCDFSIDICSVDNKVLLKCKDKQLEEIVCEDDKICVSDGTGADCKSEKETCTDQGGCSNNLINTYCSDGGFCVSCTSNHHCNSTRNEICDLEGAHPSFACICGYGFHDELGECVGDYKCDSNDNLFRYVDGVWYNNTRALCEDKTVIKCEGGQLYQEDCEEACSGGNCVECNIGDKKCVDGNTIQECSSNNTWGNKSGCGSGLTCVVNDCIGSGK